MISNFSSSHLRNKQGEAQAPGGRAWWSGRSPSQGPKQTRALAQHCRLPLNKGTACGHSSHNLFD